MEENKKPATETTSAQTIAPEDKDKKVIAPTDDAEARIAALEDEKATLIANEANYKIAYLKEKSKNKEPEDLDETEEERIRRIANEELSKKRISEIDKEKEELLKKTLKENKELKLAQLNKTDIPASTTTHTEGQKVTDTLVTPEQLAAFKAKGWTDKDIERYKKNLVRYR